MSDIEIVEWKFDPDLPRVWIDIDGKKAICHFRTEEDGGQRDEELVEDGLFPIWEWDGDREEPTLEPSLRIWGVHFHIKDGEVVPA